MEEKYCVFVVCVNTEQRELMSQILQTEGGYLLSISKRVSRKLLPCTHTSAFSMYHCVCVPSRPPALPLETLVSYTRSI